MMNDERYVRKGYKIWDTYSDREVQELNYRYQSDDICELLNKQQATIKRLEEENEQLKQQLLYDGDDVCGICKHEYLTPSGNYFIGKCKKGHEECSKEDIEYCEDFEFKGDDNGY